MKIRNRTTYLTSLPEGSAPESTGKRLTFWLYFGLLACIALFLAYYTFNRLVYVVVRGQVEVSRVVVRAAVDGIINELMTGQGDEVAVAQTLASIQSTTIARPNVARDILRTEKELKKKRYELKHGPAAGSDLSEKIMKITMQLDTERALLAEIDAKAKGLSVPDNSRAQEDRLLELHRLEKGAVAKGRRSAQDLTFARERSLSQIAALEGYRKQMKSLRRREAARSAAESKSEIRILEDYLNGLEGGAQGNGTAIANILAPTAGKIQAIYRQQGEEVSVGDPVMALRNPQAGVVIHAYFDVNEIDLLQAGKKVSITLPDGSSSSGVIINYYSAASAHGIKLKELYVPVKSVVLAEIIPVSTEDARKWQDFDLLDVTVKVRR